MRGTSISRLLSFATVFAGLAGAGLATSSTVAQSSIQSSIPNRITAAVSSSRMVEIPGSVHLRALQATDLGPAPGDTRLNGMSLRFTPSVAQQAALDQLLVDLQDPASPRYHQWLTPQQYAAQFGLSSADLAKVTAWLASRGFSVTGVAQGGGFVTFDGSVAQAQTAFSTSIHSLSVNGEKHFANVTSISVPSAFAGVIGAVTGLHDFRPRPHLHTSVVNPQFTSSLSGNHYLTPGDIYTIYDVNPLLASSVYAAGTGSLTGAGITIAVTGQVDLYNTGTTTTPIYADVIAFRGAAGLSTTNLPTTVHEGTDPGQASNCSASTSSNCPSPNLDDLGESSIDVEWSGAMAPSASILFVNAANVLPGGIGEDAMTQVIDQDLAPIITTSYGACEAGWGSSFLNPTNQLFKEANAQGQTILAAAGDDGATDCDAGPSATEGLAVDFPASSPYVTGMGGTQFNGDAEPTGSGTTWGATQYWKGTSGSDVISSALSYIPEAAWNDASAGYFGGGGGGASSFFPKPAWQVETGASGMTTLVSTDASRDVPDLALDASDVHDDLLFCVSGSCSDGFRIASGTYAGDLNSAGGTSFDSQIFGGMLALIEQKTGAPAKGLGNINPTLYALGNNAAYYNAASSSVFHDVTSGGNAMQCTAGSSGCPTGGSIGYSAGTGYDLATGWGSVDLNNLANDWNLVTPLGLGSLGANLTATSLAASTTTSSATNVTVTPTATVTVTLSSTVVSLTPNFTPGPTGTVQFLANNLALGSPIPLVNDLASTTFVASCSTLGQQSMTAVYSGDSNYQGSIGPALTTGGTALTQLIVTVTGSACASFSLSPASTVFSVASGGSIPSVAISVVPANGLTGTVTFSGTTASTSGYIPTLSFSPTSVAISSASSVSTTLSLSGITASLRLPNAPGKLGSGVMLAQQAPASNHPWSAAGSGVTLACLLLLVLPRKRRLGGLLLLAFSVALIAGVSGCGSSQSSPPTNPTNPTNPTTPTTNPYAGTYTVTVVGTYSGSVTLPPQTVILTYNIQ
jgi:subtilase family serine protease